jgi:hypothetical protein
MYTAYASSAGDAGYIGNGQGILSTAIESDFAIRSEAALLFAAGGQNERMRINSVGQLLLGISSTSETTKLFVKQSQDLDYRGISVESAAAGGFFGSMSIDANGNLSFAHSYTGGSGSYRDIRFLTSNVERMRITSDGNVLIGTTTLIGPVQGKLDVQYDGTTLYGMNLRTTWSGGGLAISFNNSSGSQIGNINTTFSATSYNTSSDYRLKTDLKDFNGMDIINKIKTYDFKWKSENSRSYGVIAHELQEVIDYVVHGEKDSLTMQGVDYSKLVPIMVKAIQEQQVQIQELKNKLS